eukprot:scaffold886_cov317-Prasinococcus_capsulatus_cf.AAC.9
MEMKTDSRGRGRQLAVRTARIELSCPWRLCVVDTRAAVAVAGDAAERAVGCHRWIRAGKHLFVFRICGPLYLVAVACTGEPVEVLDMQLRLFYDQVNASSIMLAVCVPGRNGVIILADPVDCMDPTGNLHPYGRRGESFQEERDVRYAHFAGGYRKRTRQPG